MSQLFTGSLNLSKLIELAKKKHSGFWKSDKGQIYANIEVWANDIADKYGNEIQIKLNTSKAGKEHGEAKEYIANAKKSTFEQQGLSDADISQIDDDLPF